MSDLKNPMRFTARPRSIDITNWLDHDDEVDDVQWRVTEIEFKPGQIYVHWEVEDD